MSRRGNCYDKAVMKNFFSTLKSELGERFDSHGEAKMALFADIEVFHDKLPKPDGLKNTLSGRCIRHTFPGTA